MPGQRIEVDVQFRGDPTVAFSYQAPGGRVTRDPGAGQAGSRLRKTSPGAYRAAVDTRGMAAGQGWIYIVGEDDSNDGAGQNAEVWEFQVLSVPPALLGMDAPPQVAPPLTPLPRTAIGAGLVAIGAGAAAKWGILAGVGVAAGALSGGMLAQWLIRRQSSRAPVVAPIEGAMSGLDYLGAAQ